MHLIRLNVLVITIVFIAISSIHDLRAEDAGSSKVMLISRFDRSMGLDGRDVSFLYYGFLFENDYESVTEVNFTGSNLARSIGSVSQTHRWMNAYKWSRIGMVVSLIGGFGLAAGGLFNGWAEEQDGRSFDRTPVVTGLSIAGFGLSLEIGRHFWIRKAVAEYNAFLTKQH